MPLIRPFGSWSSPISAARMTESAIGLSAVGAYRDRMCWLEARSEEKGRVVLVVDEVDGSPRALTPMEHNLRSRVHEYGGGAVATDGARIVYVNFADQRMYMIDRDGQCYPVTEPSGEGNPAVRYADMDFDPNGTHIACIREDHRGEGEPANAVVLVDEAGTSDFGLLLDGGHDFFACPRFSPDGGSLCYLSWDHPNMPWDGTDLWCVPIEDGMFGEPRHVAGGSDESVFQPAWSPDGTLHFVSDRNGWWNLYRLGVDGVEPVCPIEADCGLPHWQFGMRSYDFLTDGTPVIAVVRDGISLLHRVEDGRAIPIDLGWDITAGPIVTSTGALVSCSAFASPAALVQVDLDVLAGRKHAISGTRVLRTTTPLALDPAYVSKPEPVSWSTAGGADAHGFYYPPVNPEFAPEPGTLPPLMVRSHGGPTAATSPSFSLSIQYWTTRGFAVLDVNYRGSTGYGRAYRDALKGQWGVADVEDCRTGALALADRGLADRDRLVIRGGSAGGYTTLCALAFTDAFRAGASLYGVGDLMALARDTHKFEARYLDRLIAPLPEGEELYAERSPLQHADRLDCPVIFLQGLEDKVVPPNQAEAMVEALRTKGVPVAYIAFEGEQHGFRQAENIIRATEAELYFYGRILGFEPADEIEAVEIENLA